MRLIDLDDGFSTESLPTEGTAIADSVTAAAASATAAASSATAAAGSATSAATYVPQVSGTRGFPTLITAAGGIAAPVSVQQIAFIAGNGGPVTVTKNPQIAAGSQVGQTLRLFGTHATNTLTLTHGTGLSLLDANVILGDGDSILLMWDGTNWAELNRS